MKTPPPYVAPPKPPPHKPLDCDGYRKLKASVDKDCEKEPHFHDYRGKMDWVIAMVHSYAEVTKLTPEAILDAFEKQRDYWYMNYYQPANQPDIKVAGEVRVFESQEDLLKSIVKPEFRCPACDGISKSPYVCDSGLSMEFTKKKKRKPNGKICDWKVYGLLGDLGKGVTVFVKDQLRMENIFMPVAWEPVKMSPAKTVDSK